MRRFLLAVLACVAPWGCIPQGKDVVAPQKRDVFLWSGGKDKFVLRVDLAGAPPSSEPIDILLLIDRTASMDNVTKAVRSAAGEVTIAIHRISSDTRFAVASFADYPPFGVPWSLNQDFTHDTALIRRALHSISLTNGGDIPEAYARALYESQFLSWRPVARRFIILFGDAPAHDPDFYGKNYGVDPGRDGIPGTEDDLRLARVVDLLARRGITIIPLYDSTRGRRNKVLLDDAIKGFAFMAERTGGLTKPVSSASEAPQAIAAGVREAYRPKSTVLIPEGFRSWVTVSEAKTSYSPHPRFNFDAALHPPSGTTGIYRFPLTAVYAGAEKTGEIGHTEVTLRIGLVNYPWRGLLWPLYGLVMALLGGKLAFGRPFIRYEHNGQYWALTWRVLAAILLFLVASHLSAQEPVPTMEVSGSKEIINRKEL